jgi:hypothetical protein
MQKELCKRLAEKARATADKTRELVETPINSINWYKIYSETLIELTVLEVLQQQKIFREDLGVAPWQMESATKKHFELSM